MFHPAHRFPFLPEFLIPLILTGLLIFAGLLVLAVPMGGQEKMRAVDVREQAHRSPDWPTIAAHLTDPATASLERLQMQGDILRARRFPYDALDYYGFALKLNGKNTEILKRLGVTNLELRNTALAHIYFQRVVKLDKKDAEGWNNLGAVEYLAGNFSAAIGDYKRALKLRGKSAVYHSNLGITYFDLHDYSNGRKEMDIALRLDPSVFLQGNSTGVSAHVLSPEDRARFCLEMAKTYAQQGNEAEMLHSLESAAQAGLDVGAEMGRDKILTAYRRDPRVLVLIQNARALRSGSTVASAGKPPAIPALE